MEFPASLMSIERKYKYIRSNHENTNKTRVIEGPIESGETQKNMMKQKEKAKNEWNKYRNEVHNK